MRPTTKGHIMPEDKSETTSLEGASTTKDGSAPDKDNAEGSIFDNMTPEELKSALSEKAKSYDELHSKVGQMSGELGELRSFRKEVAGESKLADAVSAVKEMVAEKAKEPELDYEAWEAKMMAEYDENPAETFKKAMRAQSSWSAQDKKSLEEKYEAKFSDLEKRYEQMGETLETTTEDYKENKELIEKLRAKGMSVKDAKAFAKDIRENLMPDAERTPPPGGISPTRVVAPEQKDVKPWTDDDVARWTAEGRSETFIANMKAKWERDANLTDKEKGEF